jgi:hypothetical protein
MAKPQTKDGYADDVTRACERVLVTLISELGPWRDSLFLVGGLTPRFLIPQGGDVPPHAGTSDVDVVIDQAILADTEAYATLEANLEKMGFRRVRRPDGSESPWRWETRVDGARMVLEFLTDAPEIMGGEIRVLPTDGKMSALNIPHSSMVAAFHESRQLAAEKLGDRGITRQTVRYADIVAFTCLKIFAFNHRAEPKDAHDLVYCLENHPGGIQAVAERFRQARTHPAHGAAVSKALDQLRDHFATGSGTGGYQLDGPFAAADFEGIERGENHVLRRRRVSALIEELLQAIG